MKKTAAEKRQGLIKKDSPGTRVSVCSAHPMVLTAAMEAACELNRPILIETTAAQVNQFGGYSGMRPADFARRVANTAVLAGLAAGQVMVGADHLGPHAWKNEPAASAMAKADTLVRQCVAAGFEKIHLDTGMSCADDPAPLSLEVITRRAARLCQAAEETTRQEGKKPVFYVIGDEVPIPGGGLAPDREVPVTDPADLFATLKAYQSTFAALGLAPAFERVIAVVVQPGVDFGNRQVSVFKPERAAALAKAHQHLPGAMTYEVHSADYQPAEAVSQMVASHFKLIKIGPCLTHALHRALSGLAGIENQLPDIAAPSLLAHTMEQLMTDQPEFWQAHYTGPEDEQKYLRHNSLKDRIRYYWLHEPARASVGRLFDNLDDPISPQLIRRFLPDFFTRIPDAALPDKPEALVRQAVKETIGPYLNAGL